MPFIRSSRFPTPFHILATAFVGLAFLVSCVSSLRAEPDAPPATVTTDPAATPIAELRTALKSLYETQAQAIAAATSESELAQATVDLRTGKEELAARAMETVAKAGPSAGTGELLLFVVTDLADTDAAAEAAKLLAKNYPARAVRVAFAVAVQPQLWSEDFLSELAKAEKLPANQRVSVELCRAMHSRSLLFLHDEAKRPFPEAAELLKKGRSEAFVAWLQSLDDEALADETIARFERLREEYGEKKLGGPTVAEHAEASIKAVRNHRLGMPAPQAIGKDLAGQPLRLGDSRGKVVLLTFWASWCAPCIAEMRRERELLSRQGEENFAILGVCLDEDLEAARKAAGDAGVTWKSFADVDHSLAEEWFAMQLPTCAVVDRDGTLQARGMPLERAEKIVERLLQAENADAKEAP